MHIDWWTLALQAINVLVLVWLLSRFLYRPVIAAIDARQAMSAKLIAEAETAKATAEEQARVLQARDQALAAEADERRAEMRANFEAERARLFEQARGKADALLKQAAEISAAEQARMTSELEERAGQLAADMAGKLLKRLPANGVTDAMLAALVERVGTLSEDRRRALMSEPLTIVTPTPLSSEARARYSGALANVMPGVRVAGFVVEPALLGGFELRGQHVLVRNSWRADLDDLLAALKEDGHARIG